MPLKKKKNAPQVFPRQKRCTFLFGFSFHHTTNNKAHTPFTFFFFSLLSFLFSLSSMAGAVVLSSVLADALGLVQSLFTKPYPQPWYAFGKYMGDFHCNPEVSPKCNLVSVPSLSIVFCFLCFSDHAQALTCTHAHAHARTHTHTLAVLFETWACFPLFFFPSVCVCVCMNCSGGVLD